VTLYIEGVGGARHPVTGMIFGKGMGHRIEAMYAKLIKLYKPNDNVYIFGFSRGAHIARALTGLIFYAGIPVLDSKPRTPANYLEIAQTINEAVREYEDSDSLTPWEQWQEGNPPPLSNALSQSLDYNFQAATIQMLGIWDTVPGTFFKDYGNCVEKLGGSTGTRYKTNSYPNTKRIAHAVSADEKRSAFELLHICTPPIGSLTIVDETYFPGAHSDIGGGYTEKGDKNTEKGAFELPNISLKWMFDHLEKTGYPVPNTDDIIGNPMGLAHWSHSGFINVLVYKCIDRNLTESLKNVPDKKLHPSIGIRRTAGPVPLQVSDDPPKNLPYPISCNEFKHLDKQGGPFFIKLGIRYPTIASNR
jgi:hypothetical protein